MKARELPKKLQEFPSTVDWVSGNDQFLVGDAEADVSGMVVSWMALRSSLTRAKKEGYNLFITHERPWDFLPQREPETPWMEEKRTWCQRNAMIIYRCHDFWDLYPEIGILGAWASWLGLSGPPLASRPLYAVYSIDRTTAGALARRILDRTRPLNQDGVCLVGDPEIEVSRLAIGTGAVTHYRTMYSMGADVLLVTHDGHGLEEAKQWSLDSGIPLIIVSHGVSEEPGMRKLAAFLRGLFPGIPVLQIPVGCLYSFVT